MNNPAPVILFVFNRPNHTEQTIESLKKNRDAENTVLHIFSDGPRDESDVSEVEQVRKYVHSVDGFGKIDIREQSENWGLRNSVISGVSEILNEYDAVIVLEDDIVTAPGFLTYMNRSLEKYRDECTVWSIAAHSPEVAVPESYQWDNYAAPRFSCWGWGTWRDRWEQVDWEYDDYEKVLEDKGTLNRFLRGGEDRKYILDLMRAGTVESWAAVFDFFHFLNDAVCMHPVQSLVRNIGIDGSGVNCGKEIEKNKINLKTADFELMKTISEDKQITASFMKRKKLSWKSRVKKTLRNIGLL